MSGFVKLNAAYDVLQIKLKNLINDLNINLISGTIQCKLKSGLILYVRYNNYNEYSYSVIFSSSDLDRVRFDNFDDKWDVKTRPNHYHPRFSQDAYNSPMTGDTNSDIKILTNFIKENKLFDSQLRF